MIIPLKNLKTRLLLLSWILCLFPSFAVAQHLSVSENNRYLVDESGDPFFWLGDTAWELFHRLNREEADLYLQTRAEQGFNVIQAVVLAELKGLTVPNPYGHLPLIDQDPAQPNEAYFEHVDYIVDKAASLGIYIGMLPTWGDKFNKKWGVGPEVLTPENARVYGEFLGRRYRDKPIIWILGGDRIPEEEEDFAIIHAMAAGITAGDGGRHIKTYHPQGGYSSSQFFHDDDWLDFNMFQTGHGEVANPNHKHIQNDYKRTPIKPVLDGEPNYEDHPINWRPANGWFDAFESRRAGYWAVLAGGLGHTYGNHNIWQMWQPGRSPISSARTPWWQALTYPGAYQAGYMRQFFESRAWWKISFANHLLKKGPNTTGKEVVVGRANDGSFIMAYAPHGSTFSLDLDIDASNLKAWWYHGRTGTCVDGGSIDKEAEVSFDPPGDEARGNDWVLLVEEASDGQKSPCE